MKLEQSIYPYNPDAATPANVPFPNSIWYARRSYRTAPRLQLMSFLKKCLTVSKTIFSIAIIPVRD